jgi:hypothetical protein
MRQLLLCLLLLASPAFADEPGSFDVTADQWALPRSGAALIHLQPVHDAVAAWLADPGARLVIRHAGSDVGNLWADELMDWLVALGVPAANIEKRVSADQPEGAVTLLVQH